MPGRGGGYDPLDAEMTLSKLTVALCTLIAAAGVAAMVLVIRTQQGDGGSDGCSTADALHISDRMYLGGLVEEPPALTGRRVEAVFMGGCGDDDSDTVTASVLRGIPPEVAVFYRDTMYKSLDTFPGHPVNPLSRGDREKLKPPECPVRNLRGRVAATPFPFWIHLNGGPRVRYTAATRIALTPLRGVVRLRRGDVLRLRVEVCGRRAPREITARSIAPG